MTAGSVLAALGGHFLTLIIGRSLQGFAAALIPIGISIMRDELPKEKVGSAVALMSATLGIGAALGLPLSGIIFEQFGWEAIFWISAAAGVLLIVGVLAIVSESTVRTRGRFDYVGAALLSIALTALLLGISKGGSWGWGSEQVIGLFALTVGALVIWVPFELKVSRPLVDLRTSAPATGAADEHRLRVGRVRDVRQSAADHPATAASGGDRVRIRVAHHRGRARDGAVRPGHGAVRARLGAADQPLRRPDHADHRCRGDGVRLHRPGVLLRDSRGRHRRIDRGQHRDGDLLRGDADPDHGLRADHRDGVGERAEFTAAGDRYVVVQRRGRCRPRVGHDRRSGRSRCPRSPRSRTCSGWPVWWRWRPARWPGTSRPGVLPLPEPRAAVGTGDRATTEAGESREMVVHGSIRQADRARPAGRGDRRQDGRDSRWTGAGRTTTGNYSVVLPGPGKYLVLANALGWAPRAEVLEFVDAEHPAAHHADRAADPVRDGVPGGQPVADALITLSEASGELVRSTRADGAGRYCMPLPEAGRYIVTMLEPDTMLAHARKVVLDVRSAVVDIEAPAMQVADFNGVSHADNGMWTGDKKSGANDARLRRRRRCGRLTSGTQVQRGTPSAGVAPCMSKKFWPTRVLRSSPSGRARPWPMSLPRWPSTGSVPWWSPATGGGSRASSASATWSRP